MIIRSGGLGDFILTLPLVEAFKRAGKSIVLVTRASYFGLIRQPVSHINWIDVDSAIFSSVFGGSSCLEEWFDGTDVYSFWPDPDGAIEQSFLRLGASGFKLLDARPEKPPHVCVQILTASGLTVPDDLMERSFLKNGHRSGTVLWIHPGSGSTSKNAPLGWFKQRAVEWLALGKTEIVVSFGEADSALIEESEEALRGIPFEFLTALTLDEFKEHLIRRAARFVGNDGGPAHLAAALGIPTETAFLSTDPDVWRPLGENTKVIRL